MTVPNPRPFAGTPEVWRLNVDHDVTILARYLKGRQWRQNKLAAVTAAASHSAATRAVLDRSDPAIADDLATTACVAAALFAAASTSAGAQVSTPHPQGGQVTTTSTGLDTLDSSPLYWRRGLLAALIVRQFEAIEVLARISLETLRALASTMPQFMMEERKALQAIALRGPGAADQIVPAARAADPDAVGEGYRDWALDIVTPELQLGFHALAHDRAKFDEWMVIAIEGHHHYYGRSDMAKEVQGQLALAPLAMACVAHDLGVTTTIESPYIPRWLIVGAG